MNTTDPQTWPEHLRKPSPEISPPSLPTQPLQTCLRTEIVTFCTVSESCDKSCTPSCKTVHIRKIPSSECNQHSTVTQSRPVKLSDGFIDQSGSINKSDCEPNMGVARDSEYQRMCNPFGFDGGDKQILPTPNEPKNDYFCVATPRPIKSHTNKKSSSEYDSIITGRDTVIKAIHQIPHYENFIDTYTTIQKLPELRKRRLQMYNLIIALYCQYMSLKSVGEYEPVSQGMNHDGQDWIRSLWKITIPYKNTIQVQISLGQLQYFCAWADKYLKNPTPKSLQSLKSLESCNETPMEQAERQALYYKKFEKIYTRLHNLNDDQGIIRLIVKLYAKQRAIASGREILIRRESEEPNGTVKWKIILRKKENAQQCGTGHVSISQGDVRDFKKWANGFIHGKKNSTFY